MKIYLKQKSKELFTAEFDIVKDENVIGNVFVQGKLTSMEAKTTIKLQGTEIVMIPKMKLFTGRYRSYNITINNALCGSIYQKKVKNGFFSSAYINTLEYNGKEYMDEGNGMGTSHLEGMVETEKGYEVTIYNDMFNFEIECGEELEDLYKTLVYTIYKYLVGIFYSGSQTVRYFKPGEKITNSVQKIYFRSWK